MINKYTKALPVALTLAAAVGLLSTLTAAAQTTSGTGYNMLNAQSANPSASTNSSVYGSSSTTGNSTYPSSVAASSTTGTTNTTNTTGTTDGTMNATQSATPGVPNTGAGGDAPINLAVLIVSGLIVAAGMTYVTLKLAL